MNPFIKLAFCLPLFLACNPSLAQISTAADLIEMDFEDLVNMDIEVRSAGKMARRAKDVPYSAFVLTGAEIKASGVQSIPDALRMVPGVSVNQISASEWAIGIRGSGGRFSRFVLVMVDGRIAFNVVFSGVNWDELNIPMDQISRIEVIRGPNGAAWGANAVNGIIHIITKQPEEIGELLTVSASGADGQGVATVRMAKDFGDDWNWSATIHGGRWSGLTPATTGIAGEEGDYEHWRVTSNVAKVGSTAQTRLSASVQGSTSSPTFSLIDKDTFETFYFNNFEDKKGWALQFRHRQNLTSELFWKARVSLDSLDRETTLTEWNSENIQAELELGYTRQKHEISTGINLRHNTSLVDIYDWAGPKVDPAKRSVSQYGVFVSDTYHLHPELQLTAALRLDDSDLNGENIQPSMRALWSPAEDTRLWLAVSQASTTPSRVFLDMENLIYFVVPPSAETGGLPLLVVVDGYQGNQKNTRVTAVELGFRKAFDDFSVDLSLFDFHYDWETTIELQGEPSVALDETMTPAYLRQDAAFINGFKYSAHGGELVIRGKVTERWDIQFNYSTISFSNFTNQDRKSLTVSNNFQLAENWAASIQYRDVQGSSDTALRRPQIEEQYGYAEDYQVFDFSLHWDVSQNIRTSVVGRNLGGKHSEAVREEFTTTILDVAPITLLNISLKL